MLHPEFVRGKVNEQVTVKNELRKQTAPLSHTRCQLSGQSAWPARSPKVIGWRGPGGWFGWKVKPLAGGARAEQSAEERPVGRGRHWPAIHQLARTSEFTSTADLGKRGVAVTRVRFANQRGFEVRLGASPEARSLCLSAFTPTVGAVMAVPAGVAPRVRMHVLPAFDASLSERLLHRGPEYLRRHLEAPRPARTSAVERLAADRAKYVKSQPVSRRNSRNTGGGGGEEKAVGSSQAPSCAPAPAPCPVPRRAIARRPLRPDSLVIYRQKCEFVKGSGPDSSRVSLVKKFFQGPGRDKTLVPPEMPKVREEGKTEGSEVRTQGEGVAPSKAAVNSVLSDPVISSVPSAPSAPSLDEGEPSRWQAAPLGSELREVKRRGLHRSQSDISSRYSKSFAEFDTFFQYCGLDPEVVEELGRENFSAGSDHIAYKVRSVSIATSDSGFSHQSGGENGLQEDELIEQVPTTTSVIEKNARIIKWLYTCKKAKETPSKGL
ncbi:PREDICTED: protein FAM110C-like [Elephantulus edwardii]|uniref:protein FAM110C-like n=1 Tax=Elephantulus edwardii TaxID=28737 RepID=UPI0003F06C73|nr:PREDICTED: protein FAM110C-like [Elephantulus edwardii]